MSNNKLTFSISRENDSIFSSKPDLQSSQDFINITSLRQKGVVENLLGSKSEVSFGKPKIVELNKEFENKNIKLTPYQKNSKLYLLYLTCTFRPAVDTDFVRSSFKIKIYQKENRGECLALELFPRDIYMAANYKRSFTLTPSLKFTFEKISSTEITVGGISTNEEFIRYDPEIIAFGVGETEFGWDFNRSKSRAIRGIKDLYAIVEAPSGTLAMKFILDADIQTKFGLLRLPTFLDISDGTPIVSKEIILTVS